MTDEEKRILLGSKLKTLIGNENVYFQPPSNISLEYPCIVYSRKTMNSRSANNKKYKRFVGYSVTHISKNPTSETVQKLHELDNSFFERAFVANGLNHDVFTINVL